MQGKAPGDEPLPERQGQAQQGEGAENQVQDHCLFLMVVVGAIVIEPATGRKARITSQGAKVRDTVLGRLGGFLIPVGPRNETNDCRRRGDESLIRVHSTRRKDIRDSSPRLLQWLVRCISLILKVNRNEQPGHPALPCAVVTVRASGGTGEGRWSAPALCGSLACYVGDGRLGVRCSPVVFPLFAGCSSVAPPLLGRYASLSFRIEYSPSQAVVR